MLSHSQWLRNQSEFVSLQTALPIIHHKYLQLGTSQAATHGKHHPVPKTEALEFNEQTPKKKHSSKIFTAQTLKRHMQALIWVTHSPTDEHGRHITASYICLLHAQKQHSDRKTSQIIWSPLGNSVHCLSMQSIELSIEEKKPFGHSWKINIMCSSLLKDTAECGKPTQISCLAADYWGWKWKVIRLIQVN